MPSNMNIHRQDKTRQVDVEGIDLYNQYGDVFHTQ
jgi:hypothetical protein